MNLVKFYRRLPDGRVDTRLVRVTQRKREIYRIVKQKATLLNPSGLPKRLPPKWPTVRMAERLFLAAGWTREKLWTDMPVLT